MSASLEPSTRGWRCRARGLLREFNDDRRARRRRRPRRRAAGGAGRARRDEAVVLAAALAVRAPRLGHVYVDLATIRETRDGRLRGAGRPRGAAVAATDWVARVAASALVAVGDDAPERRPLRLEGTRRSTSTATGARSARSPPTCARSTRRAPRVDEARARRRAGAAVRLGEPTPGSGAPRRPRCGGGSRWSPAGRAPARRRRSRGSSRCWPSRPRATHAAGRAGGADRQGGRAARGGRARRGATTRRRPGRPRRPARARRLDAAPAARLAPGSHSRFRHDRGNRLPHDVVIVDETSMVSLSLMARLVEAVRPDARLVLVGDPGQLASIEAGAVLGDIVGAGGAGRRRARARPPLRRRHRRRSAAAIRAATPTRRSRRCARHADVTWLPADAATRAPSARAGPRRVRWPRASAVIDAARAGDGAAALAALGAFRLLCAHRRGPHGVSRLDGARSRRWLGDARRPRRAGTPAGRCWSPRTTTGWTSTTATPAWSSPRRRARWRRRSSAASGRSRPSRLERGRDRCTR